MLFSNIIIYPIEKIIKCVIIQRRSDFMNYQKKRKRQMIIIRIVAIVCAVLILGSVFAAAYFS